MLSREDHLMIKPMRTQAAYIIDIARQNGCSERTVRRHLFEPEPPRREYSRRRMGDLNPISVRKGMCYSLLANFEVLLSPDNLSIDNITLDSMLSYLYASSLTIIIMFIVLFFYYLFENEKNE